MVSKSAEQLTHIFNKLLPQHGYGLRTDQLALAQHISQALERRAVSLYEAGVGIGKTHAYLIASALVKRRGINNSWLRDKYPDMAYSLSMPIVVATSGIALQRAIMRDYIPEISGILVKHKLIKTPLTAVLRKGREHYICDQRLLAYYMDCDLKKREMLGRTIRNNSVDLAEISDLTAYDKRRVCVKGPCSGECSHRNYCRYRAYMKQAQSYKFDFQICNHNYFLADALHRNDGRPPLIPNYQAVIIDEAHKFLAAARQMYGSELSSETIPHITCAIRGLNFQAGQSTSELLSDAGKLYGQSARLFRLLDSHMPKNTVSDETERLTTVIDKEAVRHLKSIQSVSDRLCKALTQRVPVKKSNNLYKLCLRELSDIQRSVSTFKDYRHLVYWMEKPPDNSAKLLAIPKGLGDMLFEDIWSRGIPIILTSGTLSAGGDFTHVKRSLGVGKLIPHLLMEAVMPSPFDYHSNVLLYISRSVPFPDNRDIRYIDAVTAELVKLITVSHGHAAVLFTSYRAMDMVYERLEKKGLSFPLFRLDRGGVIALSRFRDSGNGILLASGSMWEGVDLPGDILSLLVIVKLPFAVPDPISDYEHTLYDSFEEYKKHAIIPDMLVKLMQGFGRLIRNEQDTGVVVIMDSRVREGGAYREFVLNALPRCPVTSNINAVKDFFNKRKAPDYFS